MKFGLFVFCMTLVPLLSWAEDEKIAVQSMSELDGMQQDKLVNLRERSMIYSAFYSYDYKPKIFERYNPKEKWVGDKYSCYRNEFYDGKSEASIWLKNPNVLIHPVAGTLRHMFYGDTNNPVFCMYSQQLMFKPKSIVYKEDKKEIVVTYKAYNILLGIGSHTFGAIDFSLSPINAYDVGFNYMNLAKSSGVVTARELRGTSLKMAQASVLPLNEDVTVCNPCYTSGYGVCSCYVKDKDVQIELKSKNAELLFKLWRDKPKSKDDAADFYYRIRFIP